MDSSRDTATPRPSCDDSCHVVVAAAKLEIPFRVHKGWTDQGLDYCVMILLVVLPPCFFFVENHYDDGK